MYDLSQIINGLQNPGLVPVELNSLYYTRLGTQKRNPNGVNFFEEDWDNLLILDAYRHDLFAELAETYGLPGQLESKISAGSATPEFLATNIDGKDLRDTVYVTATTMLYREAVLSDSIEIDVHEIIDIWADSIDFGEWGVLPESVTERTLEAIEEYPNKRIVAHYTQPHLPFLGETGKRIYDEFEGRSVWKAKQTGRLDISDETLWKAYRENAEYVTEHVADIVREFPGKTVVTADHGQLIGERVWPLPVKHYSHPAGLWVEELVEVPWLTVENGSRRRIVSERQDEEYTPDRDELDEKARNHLRNLGYVD